VSRRIRVLIAVVAMTLQGVDALVGALGHSHGERVGAVTHSHHHCGHDHNGFEADEDEPSSQCPSDSDHHDDCSICRHFLQPVAPVVVFLELGGQQQAEPHVPHILCGVALAFQANHAARGPPMIGA